MSQFRTEAGAGQAGAAQAGAVAASVATPPSQKPSCPSRPSTTSPPAYNSPSIAEESFHASRPALGLVGLNWEADAPLSAGGQGDYRFGDPRRRDSLLGPQPGGVAVGNCRLSRASIVSGWCNDEAEAK